MPIKKLASAIMMTAVMITASFAAVDTTKISTQAELANVKTAGNYALVNDIVLNGNFTPIGTLSAPFTGDFNGRGFTVSGLNVSKTDSADGWAVGLFGVIGQGGKVRNVNVSGEVAGYHAAGVLAGINSGFVEWCYSGGSVSTLRTRESNAGGLVGINSGIISQSYSDAAVGGVNTQNAGGLVGFLTNISGGVISNCFALGSVDGVRSAGGLVGYVYSGEVNNSYAAGEVKISEASGGLIGFDFGNTVSWGMQGRNPGSGSNYVRNAVVDKSYWDTVTTKQASSAGGEGLSTEKMQDVASIMGWDTAGIWKITDGGYPKFRVTQTIFEYLAGSGGRLMVGGEVGSHKDFTVTVIGISRGPLVAAVPDGGYRFVGWSDDNKNITRVDIGVDGEDKTTKIPLTAKFEAIGAELIEISNLDDLRKIGKDGDYPLNGNYALINDISDDGKEFSPIGTLSGPFTGTFTGKGDKTLILDLRITGSDNAGLFGYAKGAVIRGVSLQADASGKTGVGTLVGKSENTFIDSCAAIGGSALSSGGDGVGGLVGSSLSSVIIHSFSSASSKGANSGAGGLVGMADNSLVAYSYATFNAEADNAVGGLVGKNADGVVQFCYSSGNVEGNARAGGLIGEITENGIAYESYSAGQVVAANKEIFGIVGAAQEGAVSACYYITAYGQASIFGLTPSEMKERSNYTGWDFTTVWYITAGSYPYLQKTTPSSGDLPGLGKSLGQPVSLVTRSAPFAIVKGRTLTINASPEAALQLNLIDIRGRVAARYNTKGSSKISISKIPSGKYILEAKENGKRINVSRIVVR